MEATTIEILGSPETLGEDWPSEVLCPYGCAGGDVCVDTETGICSECGRVFVIQPTEFVLESVPDNCSNCKSSRIRRMEAWCGHKESEQYQSVTPSIRFVCDCHERGTQAEILSGDGKTVIYP